MIGRTNWKKGEMQNGNKYKIKKDGIVMWPRKEKENWWPSVAG